MKKSLFAIAAVTAFAGAAQAQSSVTVYGIMDVGYTGGNARLATASAVTKDTVSRIGNSMESGSRIGFRGTEDLGGGTAAIFTFELGMQPAGNAGSNGAAATTTASTNGNAGSPNWVPNVRQAFVGFSQKGMGNVRVGTQNTLFWEQAGSNTTGQLAQTLGSMLAPTTDGAFFGTNIASASGTTYVPALGAYTTRTTNTIRFATDRMAGVIVKGAYSISNSNSNQGVNAATQGTVNTSAGATSNAVAGTAAGGVTGGNNNQNGYQLALDYVLQKANVQASYASFTSENPYTVAQSTPSVTNNVAWGGGLQGYNAKDVQTLVTASYDFGILKAYAGWTDRKLTSALNGNAFMKRTAQEIGVRSFITPKIEGWASAGNGRYTAFGTAAPTANITGYQLGSNYWMSKRTNLYAIYGANGTSSTTQGAFNVNQYSLGARHTF
jgi:predicted porin